MFRKVIIIQETKNGKPRTLPLNQIALGVLMERAKVRYLKSDLVFLSSEITKIDRHNLRKGFNNALEKAGIEVLEKVDYVLTTVAENRKESIA